MAFAPLGIAWTIFSILLITELGDYLKPYSAYLFYFVILGVAIGVFLYSPKARVSRRLPNTDTEIEVVVGDIFKSNAPIVVAIPRTLETSFQNNAISEKSVQGQFTNNYCGDPSALAEAIRESLGQIAPMGMTANYYSNSKQIPIYPVGEVIVCRKFNRIGYLTAFATFNVYGNCEITVQEFFDCLPRLWLGIRERGTIGDVDVPLLGASYGRLNLPNRKIILRELIRSFSAASSDARLADKVTFFITPSDFEKWDFSFYDIERWLDSVCEDYSLRSLQASPVGREVAQN